jgi:methionyl-tRNA formyltransferase
LRYRKTTLKIAYFGLPLGALLLSEDGHELGPVVLSPIAAPGRRRLSQRLPGVLDALNAADDFEARIEATIAASSFDLLISWFWTRKLPGRWLERARLGAIGVHPSLLPRHRGPNPYFWSIDGGDEVAGVTVHRLSEEYDTGRVLAARSLPVEGRDAWQLARALDRPSLALLRETAARMARGERLVETTQDEKLATWAPEPSGDELRVDFGWSTERVLRRIRALSPTPGVALEVLGVPLFVTRAEAESRFIEALLPGEAHVSEALVLRTADGAVRVTRAFFPDGAEGDEDAASAADVVTLMKRLCRA